MSTITFLALSDKYKFKYLLKYPFRYIIQAWSGAKKGGTRKDHCAFKFGSYIYEFKLKGVIITPSSDWLTTLDHQTQFSSYYLKTNLTDEQIIKALAYIQFVSDNSRYSIMEYALFQFPILNKIRFKKDHLLFCDKFFLRFLQVIGLIPEDVYCAAYDVDDIPDLLSKYNLI